MKKLAVFTIVSAVVIMMAACGGKTEKVPFDNGDSADVANADPTIYGVCARMCRRYGHEYPAVNNRYG